MEVIKKLKSFFTPTPGPITDLAERLRDLDKSSDDLRNKILALQQYNQGVMDYVNGKRDTLPD